MRVRRIRIPVFRFHRLRGCAPPGALFRQGWLPYQEGPVIDRLSWRRQAFSFTSAAKSRPRVFLPSAESLPHPFLFCRFYRRMAGIPFRTDPFSWEPVFGRGELPFGKPSSFPTEFFRSYLMARLFRGNQSPVSLGWFSGYWVKSDIYVSERR